MAKKSGKSVDSVAASFAGLSAQRVQQGKGSVQPADVGVVTGIPLPSLVMRYFFRSTVFPLSKIVPLTGQEGSCKSAFLYEIMRWHYMANGGAALAQNENKDSPELRRSILKYNPEWASKFFKEDTTSLEEWQEFLIRTLSSTKEIYEDSKTAGAVWPLILGVDSITATGTAAELENIHSDGFASRGFAVMANLISRFMRAMPGQLRNYPFTVVGTNHLKPGTDAMGRPKDDIPGGKSVKFMETYEIKMVRIKDIDKANYGGITVQFTLQKNSLGPSRFSVKADLLWWRAPGPNGKPRQETAWDWETASIELLLAFESCKGKKGLYRRLQEVCDIHVISKTTRKAWSNVLGVPKDSPTTFRQLGRLLETRQDILVQLYEILGIEVRTVWDQRIPYSEFMSAESDKQRAALLVNLQQFRDDPASFSAADFPDMLEGDGGDD